MTSALHSDATLHLNLSCHRPNSQAMNTCALLQVLVHAGTGGVGSAAVSVAGALGCAVSTTASSSFKRGFLRAGGVREVASSREASFTETFSCSASAGTLQNLPALTCRSDGLPVLMGVNPR